MKLQTIHIS